jgi:hypothetical protein
MRYVEVYGSVVVGRMRATVPMWLVGAAVTAVG